MRLMNHKPFAVACLALAIVTAPLTAGRSTQDQPGSVPELLSNAFTEYNQKSNVRQAETLCDRVIATLLGVANLSDVQVQQLLTAYELRGRARIILRNDVAAREDFHSLLTRSPSHEFGSLTIDRAGPLNPQASATFEEVRKDAIGNVEFRITPEDADVQFRGAPLAADRRAGGRLVPMPVGPGSLTVQRRMYESQEITVDVKSGSTTPVVVTLKRLTSQVDFITSVPGVEITIDNVPVGVTTDAPLPEKYARLQEIRDLGPTPGWKTVSDIGPGTPTVRLKKDCHVSEEFPLLLDVPADSHVVRPMKSAAALLTITGSAGTVWIDGVDTGRSLPYSGPLCPMAEARVVEVRSSRGRHLERIHPAPGQKIERVANPHPAIAILAQNGLPAGYAANLRETVEKTMQQAGLEGATFLSVSNDAAERAMKAAGVSAGWLAFDQDGREVLGPARMMTPSTRQVAAASISSALDVQGVAEITVPEFREQRKLLLTYLASGSNAPETIPIDLSEPRSVQNAVTHFNSKFRMARVGSGLVVADVAGVAGAVVLRQAAALTDEALNEGDLIVSADGTRVPDGSSFDAIVAARKPGDVITLQVQRKGQPSPPIPVRLTTSEFGQVVAYNDETLPLSKLLLELRLAVEDAPQGRQAIARLNYAVVLMRVENWAQAKTQLDQVDLPDLKSGEGISRGTVQYYLGLCLDRLGKTDDADSAYRAAIASPGALLTADGPPVKSLAEQKLNDKTRRIP